MQENLHFVIQNDILMLICSELGAKTEVQLGDIFTPRYETYIQVCNQTVRHLPVEMELHRNHQFVGGCILLYTVVMSLPSLCTKIQDL